ncbi:hypothetical protein [Iodobacter fluviatilis]|uniref:Oxygen-regulated invasion protein OrgA n=1 Tax=Iodobacter fluviatilis TaxID=537 RepID=A0A377Q6F6_9NEIS|nr:hypothetical protein [Iodobacter fluviatilis]TCU80272.1 type III secretion system OrgA/MxiK family protein [Iodobacter fluviatilis]STQ90189.1 Oxygen-regulated invasion protein OrgA [Iodobacter fluviatilis]
MKQLLSVLYAPVDYIHPQRFKSLGSPQGPVQQQLLNSHILAHFGLCSDLPTAATSVLMRTLVSNWRYLRVAATLLGCKLGRADFVRSGQLASLSLMQQRYLGLPIITPQIALPDQGCSQTRAQALGASYLLLFVPQLPLPLAQRLPLLFAPEQLNIAMPSGLEPNYTLLNFAIDYAKTNYP